MKYHYSKALLFNNSLKKFSEKISNFESYIKLTDILFQNAYYII